MFLYVKKYAVDNGTEVHGVFYQGFVAAARGSAGKVWCREPCKRRKNSASVRRQRLDFPSARTVSYTHLYHTEAAVYPLCDQEEILAQAKRWQAQGVPRFGIVTAGRRLSGREVERCV